MPERATVFQVVQVGSEGTVGTQASANKLLTAMTLDATPNVEVTPFTPSGYLHPTVTVPGRDWTTADASGPATYTEIIYPITSHFTKPAGGTPVIPSGGTNSRYWAIVPGFNAAGTPATFTFEQGDANVAQRFVGGIFTDFGYTFSRENFEISGAVLGQKLTTSGVTLTSSPSALSLVPIQPDQVDVYADTVAGNLGTTKITRLFEGEYSSTGRYGPVWDVNTANVSYATTVDTMPSKTFRFVVEADSTGTNYMGHLRGGTTLYFRVIAQGGTIEAGTIRYKFQHDFAAKLTETGSLSDRDGVYAQEFTGQIVYDSTLTYAERLHLINSITAL